MWRVADGVAPELVVIGGGVSESAPLSLGEAREHSAARLTGRGSRPLARVRVAQLGEAAAAVALAAGFGVIALSSFATLREFGLLFAATVGLCVVADLLLLPALLIIGFFVWMSRRALSNSSATSNDQRNIKA